MSATNHQVGDVVRITSREHGHRFDIGSLVHITSMNGEYSYNGVQLDSNTHSWAFEDSECEGSLNKQPKGYEMTFSYPDGIGSNKFDEICRLLNEGRAVEFNCGAKSYHEEPEDIPHRSFKRNTDEWVKDIEYHYKKKYGKNVILRYDYFSKITWWKIHIYSPICLENNIGAKHLLSKDF